MDGIRHSQLHKELTLKLLNKIHGFVSDRVQRTPSAFALLSHKSIKIATNEVHLSSDTVKVVRGPPQGLNVVCAVCGLARIFVGHGTAINVRLEWRVTADGAVARQLAATHRWCQKCAGTDLLFDEWRLFTGEWRARKRQRLCAPAEEKVVARA